MAKKKADQSTKIIEKKITLDKPEEISPIEKKRRSLDDILKSFIDLESKVDPETGELPREYADLEKELSTKADGIGYYILTKEKEIESLKIMAESYKQKADSIKKYLDNYKKYIASVVRKFGSIEEKKNSDGALISSRWFRGEIIGLKDNSSDDIMVEDEGSISDDYKNVIVKVAHADFKKLNIPDSIIISEKKELDNTKLKKEIIEENKSIKGVNKYLKNMLSVTGLKKLKENE